MADTGALLRARSGGSREGDRNAALNTRVDRSVPPWRKWRTRSRAARCIRWIETYCQVPSGAPNGTPLKLHRYQREMIEAVLADGVRTGGVQIPRGNAKSTTWAAVGLWALCDHEDAPQVPLIASTMGHARDTLHKPAARMVRLSPELSARLVPYTSNSMLRIWSAWNDGELVPLPAEVDRLQGLNPTVALVDEAQTVPLEVWTAILQGAGKRPASLVLAIGTPRPGAQDSALWDLRERHADGAGVAWIEYAAEEGADLEDRAQWHRANPAIRAGILHPDVLDLELRTVPEHDFRMYRLGQWLDGAASSWLPPGAWDDLPRAEAPPADTPIVLALAGSWTHTVALVGCTLDGALFLAFASDSATDDVLEQWLARADQTWQVLELIVAPRIRPNLVRRLADDGYRLEVWPHRTDLEVESATEWRRAILERRLAHDGDPVLADHVAALVARPTADGSLTLVPPDDDHPVDAARAARMAWYRATREAEQAAPAIW